MRRIITVAFLAIPLLITGLALADAIAGINDRGVLSDGNRWLELYGSFTGSQESVGVSYYSTNCLDGLGDPIGGSFSGTYTVYNGNQINVSLPEIPGSSIQVSFCLAAGCPSIYTVTIPGTKPCS